MKEKKYHIDLHEGEDMVAEPTLTHRVSVMEHAVPMPMSGFENHKEVLDEIPELGNHFSWESLMESIEYCKTIADDPTKWEPYDDFKERLYQDFPWLK